MDFAIAFLEISPTEGQKKAMGGSEAAHGPHFQFNCLQVHGASLLRHVRPAPPEIPDYTTHLSSLSLRKRCCFFSLLFLLCQDGLLFFLIPPLSGACLKGD